MMMDKDFILAIWASTNTWFTTPTLLFLLLNLMIATIVITSRFGSQNHQSQQQPNHDGLARAPSVLLERLQSLNLYRYKSQDLLTLQAHPLPPPEDQETLETTTTHEELARVDKNPDGILNSSHDDSELRTQLGDSKLGNSVRSDEGTEEVKKGQSRASTVRRLSRLRRRAIEVDGVDARADDFINRFKRQLRLQRLDSIMRYKEMLSGGVTETGK